jgi:hypothetical protein
VAARPINAEPKMEARELRDWIKRRRLSHEEAARLLALSVTALRKNLYGVHPVGAQTERIAELIDRLGDPAPIAAEPADMPG